MVKSFSWRSGHEPGEFFFPCLSHDCWSERPVLAYFTENGQRLEWFINDFYICHKTRIQLFPVCILAEPVHLCLHVCWFPNNLLTAEVCGHISVTCKLKTLSIKHWLSGCCSWAKISPKFSSAKKPQCERWTVEFQSRRAGLKHREGFPGGAERGPKRGGLKAEGDA